MQEESYYLEKVDWDRLDILQWIKLGVCLFCLLQLMSH